MNLEELTKGIHKVANSHACRLMIECLKRKIVDRENALILLREIDGTSWDILTDLMLECDKLEALLVKAKNKTKTLSSRGF